MDVQERVPEREQLELQIEAIMTRPAPPPRPPEPARPVWIEPEVTVEPIAGEREAFSTWLIKQDGRREWWSALAKAAKGDRGFPRHATAETVGDYLKTKLADGDAFEQLDDADRAYEAET